MVVDVVRFSVVDGGVLFFVVVRLLVGFSDHAGQVVL